MRRHPTVLALAVLLSAACHDGAAPDVDATILTQDGGGDTSTVRPVPARIRISGRVVAVDAPIGVDSATGAVTGARGLAGVRVTLQRNVLVDGEARQILEAELVSDADGRFAAPSVPGGYYVATAFPPAASGYAEALELVSGLTAEVTVTLYTRKTLPP